MAIADNRTANRGWLLPDPTNKLKDDVARIVLALQAADGDVTDILLALGQKAAFSHTHPMSQVTGLISALAGKADAGQSFALDDLTDVTTAGVANGQVMLRLGDVWISAFLQIGNISGLEAAISGKLDAATLTSAPAKGSLANADKMLIVDSVGNVISTTLWSVIKSTLRTAFDIVYDRLPAAPTTSGADFDTFTTAGWVTSLVQGNNAHGWGTSDVANLMVLTGAAGSITQVAFPQVNTNPIRYRNLVGGTWSGWRVVRTGTEYVSTAAPTNTDGVDGDVWWQV